MIITSNETSVKFEGADKTILVPKSSIILLYDPVTQSIDVNLKDNSTIINLNYKIVESPSVNSSEELFNELLKLIN